MLLTQVKVLYYNNKMDMKNKITLLFTVIWTLLLISSCTHPESNKIDLSKPVGIQGTKFIDGAGRQVLFNGINLVNKNPEEKYIDSNQKEIFRKFRTWGFNVVRLGIIWDGLEPEPGVYNEEYLKEIDKQIEYAKKNGIYVFLDMHQDLYSVRYADGAPEWATLHENKPHVTGRIWSDAYLISPAVQTAWDNFWKNTPAIDGIGLQDHYAKAWQHVAERYAGNNTVIGYDIMNEPFVGSEAKNYMPIIFNAFSRVLKEETGKNLTMEEIASMWSNEETRYKALQMVNSKERFSKVIDALYVINSAFEKQKLQPFYQKVADAIRKEDKQKILFFNHSYFCNSGVKTALEPVKTADGKPDPLVAYSAHGYDLLVDTKNLSNSSTERLGLIMERINESSERMNVPVMLGEWGALGADVPGMTGLAYTNLHFIEKYKFSNTYWAYYNGVEKNGWFKALIRPYPAFISGKLLSYSFDEKSRDFTCEWEESANQKLPTSIFVPDMNKIEATKITVTPEGNGMVLETSPDSKGGYIHIYPTGKKVIRKLTFTIENGEQKAITLISKR